MEHKKVIKGSVILFIFMVSLLCITILLSVLYKDKIIGLVTSNVNQHLATEINVGKINFSIIKTFPFASVNFHNAYALSTDNLNSGHFQSNTDTLFYIDRISFKFNPIHLLQKKYKVNNIDIANGNIHLYADKNGEVNYIFWKKNPDQPPKQSLDLRMDNVNLKDVHISYVNAAKSFKLTVFSDRGKIRGAYDGGILNLQTDINLLLHDLQVKDLDYQINEKINVLSTLVIDKKKISVADGWVRANDMKFKVDGNIETLEETRLDLTINAEHIDIVRFISFLPLSFKEKLKNYNSSGDFDFTTRIYGVISHRQQPTLKADFAIRNGQIQKKRSRAELNNIYLKGSFSNGSKQQLRTSELNIPSFKGTFQGNELTGSLHLKNLLSPTVRGNMKGSVDIHELHRFIESALLQEASGLATLSLSFTGAIEKTGMFTKSDAAQWKLTGDVHFTDAAIKPKKGPYEYKNLNGTISLDGHHIHFRKLSVMADKNDLLINGSFSNGIPYLLGSNTNASIRADVQSNYMNLTSLAMKQENTKGEKSLNSAEKNENSVVKFPENLSFTGDFMVKDFIFKEFQARNARGKLNYRPRTIILNSVYFDALNGSISGGGVIAQRYNNDFTVRAQTKLNNINIKKLFSSFNNFGQQVLLADHLNGTLNGFINFSANWNVNLKVYRPSIACESDVKIRNGELIDFTPLLGLSKFIKVSELKHIKFSTLENKVKIQDESIIIPQMDIQSSAFNIACSGVHNFDNSYDYKVQLLLSEVISSRRDTREKIVTEFGEVKKDNLGRTKLYLSISGKGADYNVGYDLAGSKDAMKQNIKDEKQELKSILNEEFGWFKKDSLENIKQNNKESPAFIWGEDDQDSTGINPLQEKKQQSKKKKSKDYKITWDEEDN